tara:strand:- start:5021 stop:6541 length:1521 start_codon:yes stop_codon:yes gene_type:complete
MLSKIQSASLIGIDAIEITVEVNCALGLPTEHIVGLPDAVIRESKNRIKTAIKNAGFDYPTRNYTINLAPAEIPKEGATFDLPIAIGILLSTGQLTQIPDAIYVGELSLDGSVRPVKGIINISELVSKQGHHTVVVPYENRMEASLIEKVTVFPIQSLHDLNKLNNKTSKQTFTFKHPNPPSSFLDYRDVKGQEIGKRAVEIAAAGKHNILFLGPPGSGKSMLLKRLPSIMPLLSEEEALSTYKIQSVANTLHKKNIFSRQTPFRSPHHSISYAGMVGGGSKPIPGEVSLAHNGILFLDELPEFNRQVLEVLRQPIENKSITISRASLSLTFPADFMLVAAMNPCPCGYYGDLKKQCICSPSKIERYQQKLSGPILDRFDLIVEIPRLQKKDFLDSKTEQPCSNDIKNNVIKARKRQYERYKRSIQNGSMTVTEMNKFMPIERESSYFLANLVDKGHLTARSHDNIVKIAQTICDLSNENRISHNHILESLQYRNFSTQKVAKGLH